MDLFVSYNTNSISLASQEIEIALKIKDDKSGFSYGNIELLGPGGKKQWVGFGAYLETYEGSDIYKVNINPGTLSYTEGEWSLFSISATDYAGNSSIYDASWFAKNKIDTKFYNGIGKEYAPSWFQVYNYDYAKDNPLLPAPSIDAIALSDTSALTSGNGGKITFLISGKNIKSNTHINIGFTDKSTWNYISPYLQYSKTITGDISAGVYEYTANIDEYTQGGEYFINNIWAQNGGYDETNQWKNNNVNYSDWALWKPEKEKEQYEGGTTVNSDLNSNLKKLKLNIVNSKQDFYCPDLTNLDFKIISLSEASDKLYDAYKNLHFQLTQLKNTQPENYKYLNDYFGLQDYVGKMSDPDNVNFAQVSVDAIDDSSGLSYISINLSNDKTNKTESFLFDGVSGTNMPNYTVKAQVSDIWQYWSQQLDEASTQLSKASDVMLAQGNKDYYDFSNLPQSDSFEKLKSFIGGWSPGMVNSGPATDKSIKWIKKLDKYSAEGTYSVDSVNITDKAGKSKNYDKKAFKIQSWSYQDKLVNPYSDVEPPQIDMVSIQSKLDTLNFANVNGSLKINLKSDSSIKTWLKDLGDSSKWNTYEAYQQEKQYAYKNISWKNLDLSSISKFSEDGGVLDWNLIDIAAVLSTKANQEYANQIDWSNVSLDSFNSVKWDAKLFDKAFKNTTSDLNVVLNSDYFNSIKNSPADAKKFFKSLYLSNFQTLYSKTYENIDWAYFAPSKWDNWIYKDMNFNKVQFSEFSGATYKIFNWNLMGLGLINAKTAASIDWNKVNLKDLFGNYKSTEVFGSTSKIFKPADLEKISLSQLSQTKKNEFIKSLDSFVSKSAASVLTLESKTNYTATNAFDVFVDKGGSGVIVNLSTDSASGDVVVLNKKSKNVSIYGFDAQKDSLTFANINVNDTGIALKSTGKDIQITYKSALLATLYDAGNMTSDQIFK